jgi:LPS-assembly protein
MRPRATSRVSRNITSLSREVADYAALPPSIGGFRFASTRAAPSRFFGSNPLFTYYLGQQPFGIYNGCVLYQRGDCVLRGAAGNMNRASVTLSWRRTFIDPLGQVWTPFVSTQFDAIGNRLDVTSYSADRYRLAGNAVFGNDKQTNFLPSEQNAVRAMPRVGVDYRYPLIAVTQSGSHLFEPMAQIVASPNETRIGRLANEDSQGLVFSDSNLFSLNRFTGYDRTEGGVRANVAAQYTFTASNGTYVNALVGQSYHLAGRNSFEARGVYDTDVTNVGLNSGLDKSRSDYVGRFAFAPNKDLNFIARGRFDEESLKLQRLELTASARLGQLQTSVIYARQEAQPDLGYVRRREGLAISNTLSLPNNWAVNGNVLFDLDRYITDRDLVAANAGNPNFPTRYNNTPFRVSGYGLGVTYADECTVFSIQYSRSTTDTVGTQKQTSSAVTFRLELKNLGQLNYRVATGTTVNPDGTRSTAP